MTGKSRRRHSLALTLTCLALAPAPLRAAEAVAGGAAPASAPSATTAKAPAPPAATPASAAPAKAAPTPIPVPAPNAAPTPAPAPAPKAAAKPASDAHAAQPAESHGSAQPAAPKADAHAEPTPGEAAHGEAAAAKAAPAEHGGAHTADKKPAPSRPASEAGGEREIASLLKLGFANSDRGDWATSEIAFRQVMNLPGAPDAAIKQALLGLAQMHRRQGAQSKAVAIYERFLKDFPGDERTPDALLALGRTLRDLGAHKMAISRFYSVINSTLKLNGDGFERYQALARTAQFEIAETHFLSGDFAEASKFFTRLRLLDLAPADRARAHFKASYALRLQGDLEAAVTSLRSYLQQWPQDENVPEARYLLALTLRELKRTQEAFSETLELLKTEKSRVATDPKRWAYWQRRTGNQLANDFFESGNVLNAQAIYAGLLELGPEPAWRLPISYQMALCYERMGQTGRARDTYRAIIDGAGKDPAPDLAELARMATWRVEHLEWKDSNQKQVAALFESVGVKPATPSPAAAGAALPAATTPPVSPVAATPATTGATVPPPPAFVMPKSAVPTPATPTPAVPAPSGPAPKAASPAATPAGSSPPATTPKPPASR